MKLRNGFVSNSSSSSFILDLREPEAKEYLEDVRADINEKTWDDLSRCSGYQLGEAVVNWALKTENQWLIGPIMDIANEIGAENLLLVMISDEEMGGYTNAPDNTIVLYETEYH